MAIPKLITAPAEEPITATLAKARYSILDNLQDTELDSYITTARKEVESYTKKSIITQTLEIALDRFPPEIELPRDPVQSIVSVKYLDVDATEQTLDSSTYVLDTYSTRTWLLLSAGSAWPHTYDAANAVKVRYLAGWGLAANVPEDIKSAIYVGVDYMARFHAELQGGVGPTTMPYQFYSYLREYHEVRI